MTEPHHRDRYWRALRPWSDPVLQAPAAKSPYPLAPPDEEPILAEIADHSPPARHVEPIDDTPYLLPPAEPRQCHFSLWEMMLLVTMACVLFALMGQLSRPVFAGVAGALSLLLLGVLSFSESRHPILGLGWWLLFAIYLIASLSAALQN
jgi:hypothetical protein